MKKIRLPLIDLLRGIVVAEMIAYHFIWNLVYLFHMEMRWYRGLPGYLWQQSICWTFILLSGFCWNLGRSHLKRGLLTLWGGIMFSLVTAVAVPDSRVHFGILTFMGSCTLLWILLHPLLKAVPPELGGSLSFGLFLTFWSWTKGLPLRLAGSLPFWGKFLLAYTGVPQKGFRSSDYFPLLPWMFLFAAGYFLYRVLEKYHLLEKLLSRGTLHPFNFLGKHSFLVYLFHQPGCYSLCTVLIFFL